ncbi:venom carboxylesterase-6-like [Neodiprion lecontei]|uniref:Carboxylic ester hydrolase n=1 Tax=Neodiprion lecontei TaxID=441921 RepID=A0ABM3G4S4_NEOLC|nr:venom carboxylesterase-6-like [Neodiprion lecontei]
MKFAVATTLLLGSVLLLTKAHTRTSPRVVTPLGLIIGRYNFSNGNRLYAAYEGVPYAEPPIGNLRFKVARPVSPWGGALIADRFGSICLQYNHAKKLMGWAGLNQSEDCLYLNIYTPATKFANVSKPLPVIFFIHGGAFRSGSGGMYGPQYLLDRDVLLVTFNHRLGPLGFLSTEDDTVPGNLGLKDQVVALKWVQDYIKYFGGDRNSVTIVGHSSGGVSVQYHYLTNVTKGLFHRGISMSGTALNSWAQIEGSLEKAKKVATILKCNDTDVKEMVECLRTRNATDIVQATSAFLGWMDNPFVPFGPVVEKGVAKDEFTFIDRPPIESLKSKKVQDLPWITSVVSEDGIFPISLLTANETLLNDLNNNWVKYAPLVLDFNYTVPADLRALVANCIKKYYFKDEDIGISTLRRIIKMRSDRLYFYHAEEAARLQAEATESPVLFYYFSYRGEHSITEALTGSQTNFGVSHLDDLRYLVHPSFDATITLGDRNMQKKLINFWVSFATNGTPEVGVDWKRVKKNTTTLRYLHIAEPNDLYVTESEDFGNKNFWQWLGFQENHDSKQRVSQDQYWKYLPQGRTGKEYADDLENNKI